MEKTTRHLCFAAATLAALSLAPGAALAATVTLTATLTGANETAGGDPDATGKLVAEIDADVGDFCYTLEAKDSAKPVAAHVHEGAAGSDGKPVITLEVTGPDGDMCIAEEPDLLKAIIANPAGYYANIHTGDYPKGALRGQLAKGG